MRFFFLIVLVAAPLLRAAEEPAPLSAGDYERALAYFEAGDVPTGLKLMLSLMRKGPKGGEQEEDIRASAKDYLLDLGIPAQELFTLDVENLKAAEFNALAERVAALRAKQRRLELEYDYAEGLEGTAVEIKVEAAGVKVIVDEKSLALALRLYVNLALSGSRGWPVEEAQRVLEALGIVGAKVEPAQAALTEGKLPAEVRQAAEAAVLIRRLDRFRDWLEEVEEMEGKADPAYRAFAETAARQGPPIYRHVLQHHAGTVLVMEAEETMEFWKARAPVTGGPAPGDF